MSTPAGGNGVQPPLTFPLLAPLPHTHRSRTRSAPRYASTEKEGPARGRLVAMEPKTFFLYMIPACMYQISNLLWFLLVMVINPALALPMGSMKVLLTGILVHSLALTPIGRNTFKTLHDVQWLALVILVVGVLLCAPEAIFGGGSSKDKDGKESASGNVTLGLLIALGYSFAGTLGNVSCELLFKRPSREGENHTQGLLMQNMQVRLNTHYIIYYILPEEVLYTVYYILYILLTIQCR